jgi:flagellar basal-body rod modification protein FlgD
MAVSSVGGGLSLDQNQFLQLFVTQLQNQDPLNPVDAKDSLAQMAQFSTLESLQNLNASFSQVLSLTQLTQGSDLLGKTISFTGADGAVQSGVVGSVSVKNGNISLNVGAASVPLNQILGVQQTPAS